MTYAIPRLVRRSTRRRLAGDKPGDPKIVGLSDGIQSIVDYLTEVGHSYGIDRLGNVTLTPIRKAYR